MTTTDRLWSINEAATYLGIPRKTLYQWRHTGDGPPSHRLGRHVRYDPTEVRTWALEQV